MKTKAGLAPGSLVGYINSATAWLQTKLGLVCSDVTTKHSMIADVLLEAHKWRKPKPKREPYTYKMFQTLHARIDKKRRTHAPALYEREAAVYDWARLSVYTGSRSGEYAQTVGTTTEPSRVPDAPFVQEWAKEPIAFVASDFTFFSADSRRITLKEILENPNLAHELHVRFRYDKSGRNFTIRKFRRGKGLLCPIDAAISILLRAAALKVHQGILSGSTTTRDPKAQQRLSSCSPRRSSKSCARCVWKHTRTKSLLQHQLHGDRCPFSSSYSCRRPFPSRNRQSRHRLSLAMEARIRRPLPARLQPYNRRSHQSSCPRSDEHRLDYITLKPASYIHSMNLIPLQ